MMEHEICFNKFVVDIASPVALLRAFIQARRLAATQAAKGWFGGLNL
jgi:hypothetical protein